MANVNKVEYNGTTLIDLTGDTVTADSVLEGVTVHLASGEKVEGTMDLSEYLKQSDVVNNLTSSSTIMPLSAYQGKILNGLVGEKQAKSVKKSNITVSVTPTALSSYCAWDTEQTYGYSASVTVSGLTTNSMIQNIVMTDTLLDTVAPVVTTGANSLTFYTEDATALSGVIYTLVVSEVS